MTRGQDSIEKGKCKKNLCPTLSSAAWTDLNSQGNILKLHDKCPNPKCNCQKSIAFTPHQYMLEGGSIKSNLQKIIKGTKTAWDKFLKPALNMASPFIGTAVSARTKILKIGQAATNISKSISGGKTKSLTDMHRRGLRLKVM